jgi:redox-regulated HSP33 family molecular chaperone
VWRTLRLLPKSEVRSILDEEVNKEGIEFGCEFCGTKYKLAPSEVEQQIFGPSSADN